MCGTVAAIGVQVVPQGRLMVRLGISKVVAGFWAYKEPDMKMPIKADKKNRDVAFATGVISIDVSLKYSGVYNIQK
jgi:hypothetical protein